jgi:hypothetical protein
VKDVFESGLLTNEIPSLSTFDRKKRQSFIQCAAFVTKQSIKKSVLPMRSSNVEHSMRSIPTINAKLQCEVFNEKLELSSMIWQKLRSA